MTNKDLILLPVKEAVNQSKLVIKAFGLGMIKPKFYNVQENANEIDARDEGINEVRFSEFGLPVFDSVYFDAINYEVEELQNGVLTKKNVSVSEITLAVALVEVSQSKNIVSTPISGRNGTVKEYVSDGDYMINIKGVLVGKGVEVMPKEDMDQLIAFCKAPVSIPVFSNRLFSFGVNSIVIKDYNFSQLEGKRNVIPFELICLSDTPFEIQQS